MKTFRLFVILLFALVALCATACQKTCRCYGYDGTATDYSRDEVEELGGSCSGLIYMYNSRYYSLCEWDD
ncbi:MAG: hypothetical protein IJ620_02175 [Bacteroidales bacterium]|nr:hypothetical protein [Bacteroidales bacterium]